MRTYGEDKATFQVTRSVNLAVKLAAADKSLSARSGGLEILFGNQPEVEVDLNPTDIGGGSQVGGLLMLSAVSSPAKPVYR